MGDVDKFFQAVANVQCRRLLVNMLSHDPEDESKVYTGDVEPDDEVVTDHLIEMEHTHLPLLEEYELIDRDRENHEVTKGPKFDEIRPLPGMMVDHRDEVPENWLDVARMAVPRGVHRSASAFQPGTPRSLPSLVRSVNGRSKARSARGHGGTAFSRTHR